MYTRSYTAGVDQPATLPENYDGTAFQQSAAEVFPDPVREDAEHPAQRAEPAGAFGSRSQKGGGKFPSLSEIPILGSLFRGQRWRDGGFLSSIGTEELLIIGLALFLLLSKDGDPECALMLILLLFISD